MSKIAISAEKDNLLHGLIKIYRQEVMAIYAIGVSWEQLKDDAKDQCAEDFDKAIIARETFIEEVLELKHNGAKVNSYETYVYDVDQLLLEYDDLVKELYGLDVKLFLNVKSKALLKAK